MATTVKNTEASTTVQKLSINAEDVREVIELEHTLTFREALSLYPKAIGWSFYFSLGVIMLGMIMAGPGMFAPCS
jgi:SP family general alpha glucoside:H+ symporter-like MFS transporter